MFDLLVVAEGLPSWFRSHIVEFRAARFRNLLRWRLSGAPPRWKHRTPGRWCGLDGGARSAD